MMGNNGIHTLNRGSQESMFEDVKFKLSQAQNLGKNGPGTKKSKGNSLFIRNGCDILGTERWSQ